jgi:hypothetical protein
MVERDMRARSSPSADEEQERTHINIHVAHAGRMYDYTLGGTTNFEVDRRAAHEASAAAPGGWEGTKAGVRANRMFLGRAVRYLAGEVGLRQFLDVGTGIPSADNTHAVAQQVAPESRIVYVDNDPIVLSHAHALLDDEPHEGRGRTTYLMEDMRHPAEILRQAEGTLDLREPVGIVLVAILHFVVDEEDPYGIVAALLDAVPSGSYLVMSHLAGDIHAEEMHEAIRLANETNEETFVLRTRDEFARFFDGLDVVEPGIVQVREWRPDENDPPPPDVPTMPFYAAVAHKP